MVLMPSLSKQNLFSAMKARRFYGSDDANAQLDFRINNSVMGSRLSSDAYPSIFVQHTDPDGEQADTIRIWKGFRGSSSWSYVIAECLAGNLCEYTDSSLARGKEYYYFCELRQKDGQWMVSSPIWYTPGKRLGMTDFKKKEQVHWSYSSITHVLEFSSEVAAFRQIKISSTTGTQVILEAWEGAQKQINVSLLPPGLYLLEIESTEQQTRYKFIR